MEERYVVDRECEEVLVRDICDGAHRPMQVLGTTCRAEVKDLKPTPLYEGVRAITASSLAVSRSSMRSRSTFHPPSVRKTMRPKSWVIYSMICFMYLTAKSKAERMLVLAFDLNSCWP
jgi:hypothetical protein